jgi:Tfp pilus assembly protein PilV
MKNQKEKGLSLIEAVVAILIFSFIILFVFQLFLSSYQGYEQTRSDTAVANLAQQEMELAREDALSNNPTPPPPGTFPSPYSHYNYTVSYQKPYSDPNLVRIKVTVQGPLSKKMTLYSIVTAGYSAASLNPPPTPGIVAALPPPTPAIP